MLFICYSIAYIVYAKHCVTMRTRQRVVLYRSVAANTVYRSFCYISVVEMSRRTRLTATIRSFLLSSLISLAWFVVGSHGGCGHKISHAYLAGATTAEYPGIAYHHSILTLVLPVPEVDRSIETIVLRSSLFLVYRPISLICSMLTCSNTGYYVIHITCLSLCRCPFTR